MFLKTNVLSEPLHIFCHQFIVSSRSFCIAAFIEFAREGVRKGKKLNLDVCTQTLETSLGSEQKAKMTLCRGKTLRHNLQMHLKIRLLLKPSV